MDALITVGGTETRRKSLARATVLFTVEHSDGPVIQGAFPQMPVEQLSHLGTNMPPIEPPKRFSRACLSRLRPEQPERFLLQVQAVLITHSTCIQGGLYNPQPETREDDFCPEDLSYGS